MKLFLDIETRSQIDLRKTGQYVYANSPTTEILVVCFAIDDGPVESWYPRREPMPFELALCLDDPAVELIAHNASFERVVMSRKLRPHLADLARWNCTAARAARFGLPRTLEGAGHALGLPIQKDGDGHKLMLRMCKPLPLNQRRAVDGVATRLWLDDDESLDRLGAYCVRDVEAERGIDRLIPNLTPFERRVWTLTEQMNDRGILVDDVLLSRAVGLVERAEADVNRRLVQATNGRVQKVTNHGAITAWLQGFGMDDSDLADGAPGAAEGLGADGVGKAALAAMLERDDLPDLVREVLIMRQENGKSSAAKYTAILNRLDPVDRRIRGVMVYCGAASTGRWSSRGAQLHNLPRSGKVKKLRQVEELRPLLAEAYTLQDIEAGYGPPMVVASELLRPTFVSPPGAQLARGDSKQIEARVLPWLAGAEWKLDAFRRFDRGEGPDLYKIGAGGIYHVPPDSIGDDDPRRQIGKVSELALGFQGGARALQAMAKGYGIKIPRYVHPEGIDFRDRPPAPDGSDEWIKEQWRVANPEVADSREGFWRRIDDAAIECMSSAPGPDFSAGPHISFRRNGKALRMRLPSGNPLLYWEPRLVETVTPWGAKRPAVRFMAEDAQSKRWTRFSSYGGLWTENAVQATARDLMAWWLLELDAAGLPPVLSVHDEGVTETSRADAAAEVSRIMTRLPPWAAGLPVGADASAGPRYLK